MGRDGTGQPDCPDHYLEKFSPTYLPDTLTLTLGLKWGAKSNSLVFINGNVSVGGADDKYLAVYLQKMQTAALDSGPIQVSIGYDFLKFRWPKIFLKRIFCFALIFCNGPIGRTIQL